MATYEEWHDEDLGSPMFSLRFDLDDPQERWLLQQIRGDTRERRVNVSSVIKDLLFTWYKLRQRLGRLPVFEMVDIYEAPVISLGTNGNGHKPALPEPEEDPNDELVQRMAGISFENI